MKKYIIFVFVFISIIQNIRSQNNPYSAENTLRFADYLYRTRQYKFAGEEYQRAMIMDTNNLTIKYRFTNTCRMAKDYQQGIAYLQKLYAGNLTAMDSLMANEYIKLLILDQKYSDALIFIDQHTILHDNQTQNYRLHLYLLENKWEQARQQAKQLGIKNQKINDLIDQTETLKTKKASVAALLSTLIPGTGKIYAGQTKDGLISLLMIGGNAWQAYRGFRKNGIHSTYGWIFGSLGFVFYCGNIFGSAKAAQNHNLHKNEILHKQAVDIIESAY